MSQPRSSHQSSGKRASHNRSSHRGLAAGCVIVMVVLLNFFSTMRLVTTSSVPEVNQSPLSISLSCPSDWSQEECHQWQLEAVQKRAVERQIQQEMIQSARERAQRDEYNRKKLYMVEQQNKEYYEKVQKLFTFESKFAAWSNFSHNSFADLSIAGFPKAGTSHLYKLLLSHENTAPVFSRKEFCMNHYGFLDYTQPRHAENPQTMNELQKALFRYHKQLLNLRTDPTLTSQPRDLFINACLQTKELEYHLAYAPIPTTAKFFLLFRDPADWLWASWNFWIDKNLDVNPPVDHDWATVGIHYRSPELFHEFILSQELTATAGRRFRSMREQTVHTPRRLQHTVGKERILFIKSEDMEPQHVSGILRKISDFTGLSVTGFNETITQGRTNCNAQKGFQNLCKDKKPTTSSTGAKISSAYEITHNRPMLEATRQLIYIQFWEECNIWAEEFGVVYPECLQAVPNS
eukprot:Nitzschia sp. Nitz4//scaffold22_size323478//62989//64377//NITZ4_000509-RA/size323478-processed-gene-0.389-mRNA-1//1//CDS//3329542941//6596//frame0